MGVEGRRGADGPGDLAGVLTLEGARDSPLQGQAHKSVDLGAGDAIGVEDVGSGLERVEAHGLDHLGGLFAKDFHGLLEDRVFVGVDDRVRDGHAVAVLDQRHRHVRGRELLGRRGDALGQGVRGGVQELYRRKVSTLSFLPAGFARLEFLQNQVRKAAIQHVGGGAGRRSRVMSPYTVVGMGRSC